MHTHPHNRERVTTAPGLYHVHHGDVFLPGAGNIVFEPRFALPIIYAIGHGIPPRYVLRFTQNPQIMVSQAATVAGIGGLTAGQFINQPLNVPTTTNGSE